VWREQTSTKLRRARLPFALSSAVSEMLWPNASEDDELCRRVREQLVAVTAQLIEKRRVDRPNSIRIRSR
jgi:hypothetical protein